MTELPPRPDPVTGEPFPRAAVYPAKGEGKSLGNPPPPPPGMGRALAWYRTTSQQRWGFFALALLIIVGGASLLLLLFDKSHNPVAWMRFWQLWLVAIVVAFLWADPLGVATAAAGADWLALRKRRWLLFKRDDWVKLYELVSIEWTHVAGLGDGLHLADEEREISFGLDEVSDNRAVWELVYTGILHSVANGAYLNTDAAMKLDIDTEHPAQEAGIQRRVDIATRLANDPSSLTDREIAQIRARPAGQKIIRRNGIGHGAPLQSFREALEHEAKADPQAVMIMLSEG